MIRKYVECLDIVMFRCGCCYVGDNRDGNEIYALVSIGKWYAHSLNHLFEKVKMTHDC